jgi:hypothetical protein
MFAKNTLPVIIASVVGFVFAVQWYVPHETSEWLLTQMNQWMLVIFAFALLLGVLNISIVHARKIQRLQPGWAYSVIVFVSVLTIAVPGFISFGESTVQSEKRDTIFGWIYKYALNPLQATMFATLAFYVASAAFRAFRAKSLAATLLLSCAVVMLLGKTNIGANLPYLSDVVDWMMTTLNMPAQRAIIIGVALGAVATSVKLIAGIERTYMGGRDR